MPTETVDIRDIKGLEHFSYSPFLYIMPAAILVVVSLFLWAWIRRRRRLERPAIVAPPRPPHELAIDALNTLQHNNDWSSGGELKFHFALSSISRRYIEARFGIPATDMTTAEIVRALPALADINEKNRTLIHQLLNDTDLVKFADERHGQEYGLKLLDWAKTIVRETTQIASSDGGKA